MIHFRLLRPTAVLATGLLAFAAGQVSARQRVAPAVAPAPHATQLGGEYWTGLAPSARQVYLTGFLAGAAAEQARAAADIAGRGGDSAAISSGAIDSLRRQRALHFRFAPSVYSAQVDDFYWWRNHRQTPIVDALIFFNREMLKQQTQAAP